MWFSGAYRSEGFIISLFISESQRTLDISVLGLVLFVGFMSMVIQKSKDKSGKQNVRRYFMEIAGE